MDTTTYSSTFIDSSLDRNPLYAQVAERVMQEIVARGPQGRTKLPSERELSEQFGVSRVVIREAMKVLVRNGVVVVEPGRGTFTADRTQHSLSQSLDLLRRLQGLDDRTILEVRMPLEIAIARLAAARADAADLASLEASINELEQSTGDVDRHVAADERFHHVLAIATKNQLFQALAQPLMFLLRDTRVRMARMQASIPDLATLSVASHQAVLAAIRQRDVEAAEREMRAHMGHALNVVMSEEAGRRQ